MPAIDRRIFLAALIALMAGIALGPATAWAQQAGEASGQDGLQLGAALPIGAALLVLILLGLAVVWRWRRPGLPDAAASSDAVRRTIESISEGFAIYDSEDRLVICNEAYRGFFGDLAHEARPGRTFTQILQKLLEQGKIAEAIGREEEWLEERVKRHQMPGEPFEMRFNERWVEVREERHPDGYVSLFMIDVSARKAIEATLEESEERYRQVVDDQTEMICRYQPDSALTFVNEAFCRYVGQNRESLLGKLFLDLVPEEEREAFRERLRRAAETDKAMSREARVVGPKGESRWQQWTDRAFKDDQGRVIEYQSVGRDITERRVVEERFRTFVDNAPAAISIKDREGRYLLVNRKFSELTSLEPSEVIGRTSTVLFPEDFAASGIEHDTEVLSTNRASAREELLVTERKRVHLLTVKFPLLDEPGDTGLVGAIHTDITPLKWAEAELAVAKDEAEKASAAKTRFLSAASHDLRQPLHAMRLLFETLRMTKDPGRKEQIFDQVGNALASMSLMLNALLDIGELESGAVKAKIADVRIDPLLESLVETVLPSADEKGIMLRYQPSSAIVRTDPVLLSRILDNFLSNAVRYTDSGKILVGCRRSGDHLRVEVWDSGRGIPDESLEEIFEDYRQIGNTSRDRSQGLGLGLGITQRLARLLGHRVSVRSWHGRGSVFMVELPMGNPADLDCRPDFVEPATLHAEPSSVLFVEDDPLVAEAAGLLLRTWGIEVTMAGDAEAAMAQLETLARPPDVIIADYRLPNAQSGVAVIGRVRERFESQVPAIVITGDISAGISKEAEAANCKVLRKPVEPSKLRALLRACVSTAGLPNPRASEASPASRQVSL